MPAAATVNEVCAPTFACTASRSVAGIAVIECCVAGIAGRAEVLMRNPSPAKNRLSDIGVSALAIACWLLPSFINAVVAAESGLANATSFVLPV